MGITLTVELTIARLEVGIPLTVELCQSVPNGLGMSDDCNLSAMNHERKR